MTDAPQQPSAADRPARGRHRRDTGEQATPQPRERARRSVSRATRVVLALCVLPAVAAIVLLAAMPSGSARTPLTGGVARAATAAARIAVQQILSYDYRHIATDVKQARSDATGVFAKQYAGTAGRLLAQATQQKAIVQATAGASGVVSAESGNVVVLLFVDQATVRQTPGTKTPTTRIDQSRVRVTMTRVGGRWLVSQLAAL